MMAPSNLNIADEEESKTKDDQIDALILVTNYTLHLTNVTLNQLVPHP